MRVKFGVVPMGLCCLWVLLTMAGCSDDTKRQDAERFNNNTAIVLTNYDLTKVTASQAQDSVLKSFFEGKSCDYFDEKCDQSAIREKLMGKKGYLVLGDNFYTSLTSNSTLEYITLSSEGKRVLLSLFWFNGKITSADVEVTN